MANPTVHLLLAVIEIIYREDQMGTAVSQGAEHTHITIPILIKNR